MDDVDEDTLIPPRSWRRHHHLRRGGLLTDVPPPPVHPSPGAFLERAGDVLRHERTTPDLRDAGLTALAAPASAAPLGTAALVAAVIGLPHPLELPGDRLAAWRAVFDDYRIVQPFPQLNRETFTPTTADLTEALRGTVPAGRLLALEQRGWRRGEPGDSGTRTSIELADLTGPSLGLTPILASEPLRDLHDLR